MIELNILGAMAVSGTNLTQIRKYEYKLKIVILSQGMVGTTARSKFAKHKNKK
jgi:hypothetical protein